jgi:DNA-binding response OmpR family regulator
MTHILIIEDDDNIRFLLAEELALEGYDVREARDGAHGLSAAAEEVPDAVVLDLMMPGIPGEKVLTELKNRYPLLPVVVFSAYPDRKPTVETLGADAFCVKSSDRGPLLDALKRLTA